MLLHGPGFQSKPKAAWCSLFHISSCVLSFVICPSSPSISFVNPDALCGPNLQLQHVYSSSMCIIQVVHMPLCSACSRVHLSVLRPTGTSGEENSLKINRNMCLTCRGGSSRGHAQGGGQGTGGRFPGPHGRHRCETGHGNGRGNYLPRSTHGWRCGRDRTTNWEGRTG